jgi:alkanesulfonate monooxygenase SsuD/methylene tetrahydromethanopterin reductase-like flavin-dependent oxidoreductase (luciferase family)
MPKKYYDVMDPFVMLGAAAAVTKRWCSAPASA